MKAKILVVEDEPHVVEILECLLVEAGYNAIMTPRGDEVLSTIHREQPELVILDVMIPTPDGFEVCAAIRRMTTVPIIVLSARTKQEDVIRGLEVGADDYVTKPFNNRELMLRIQRVLGRAHSSNSGRNVEDDGLFVDAAARKVRVEGRPVTLTPTEFNLLLCFVNNRGRALSWESLLSEVWGSKDWDGGRELIKVTIRRLRKKVEPDPASPKYILTSWGFGYTIGEVGVRRPVTAA